MSESAQDILEHGGLDELQTHPERFAAVRDELRALALVDLYFLAKGCLGYDKLIPRVHGPMCRWARLMHEQGVRMTLGMAFRSGFKSTIWTVTRAVQEALRGHDVLIFHEASTKAEEWSNEARRFAFERENALLEWLFPELMGASRKASRWGDSHWQLPNGARVLASGLDTKLMGQHVDTLIMDDIFSDPKGDKTPEYAERITQWVKMSRPLLKSAALGERHLIGVPWWVSGDVYAHYRSALPAEHQFLLPLVVDGQCVWSEAFPAEVLDELRADPYVFASQYLLDPISSDTAIFKKDSVHTHRERPVRQYAKVMTVDPAFSKERRSHSTGLAVGFLDTKGTSWVDHTQSRKMDAREVMRFIFSQLSQHKPDVFGLESGGPQRAFFQSIVDEHRKYPLTHPVARIVIVELKPNRDKIARLTRLANACAAGVVRVHESQRALIGEMYTVTGARHEQNDATDAVAYLLDPAIQRFRPFGLDVTPKYEWPHALKEDALDENASRGWLAA